MVSTIISLSLLLSLHSAAAHPGIYGLQARASNLPSVISANGSTSNSSIPSNALIANVPYATICPASSLPGGALTNDTAISPAANDSANAAVEAHESAGAVSCSTLTTDSATCNTVLTGMGQLPISVTDCDEWVTFSSDVGCAAAATATATAADDVTYYLAPWQTIAAGAVPTRVRVENCQGAPPEQNCA